VKEIGDQLMRTISLLALFAFMLPGATYNIGPGGDYANIGDAPWSSLKPGDTVNVYPKTAIQLTTSAASSGTSMTFTASTASVPRGSSVWVSGAEFKTWVTCGLYGSGVYGSVVGGAACGGNQVTTADAITVAAGQTVYFTPPYFEKVILTAAGTSDSPIIVQGIADPTTGALPVLDAHNASTGPNMAHTGSAAYHDAYGFVLFARNAGNNSWPAYLTLRNLRIQSGRVGLTGYDGSNSAYTYVSGGGIRLENATSVTLEELEILDSDNGVFGKTDPGTNPAQSLVDLTVRGNHFYRNGLGSGSHQSYLEANGIVYEKNWYDTPAAGSACSQLKDRSSGTVIRYNYFYPSLRVLDLVNSQSGFTQIVPLVPLTVPTGGFAGNSTTLTFAASVSGVSVGDRVGYIHASAGWGYPGSGLPVMPTVSAVDIASNTVTLDPPGIPAAVAEGQTLYIISRQAHRYWETFVYGNIFDYDQALYGGPGPLTHYGWDTAGGIDSVKDRAGTLYFYNNTVIAQFDQTGPGALYYVTLFQAESTSENIRIDNNLFYIKSRTAGATASYFMLVGRSGYAGLVQPGNITAGANQIVSSTGSGSNTCSGITVTGWSACNSAYPVTGAINIGGMSTVAAADAYPLGISGRNYGLQGGSTAVGAAASLPAAVRSNTLGVDLTPTLEYAAVAGSSTRLSMRDLGALAFVAPPDVAVQGAGIAGAALR
jgi:hypothetical protein